MSSWTHDKEMNYIATIGDNGPRKRTIKEKIRCVEGYLRALEKPRRWDSVVFVIDLRMAALKRLEKLEKQQRRVDEKEARRVNKRLVNACQR